MFTTDYQIHQDEFAHLMPFSDQELREWGMHYYRVFEDGEVWSAAPYSISNGRLFVDLNQYGYADFYCFCDYEAALKALREFDPKTMKEPQGWHRHYRSSRRRPDGDASREHIYA